MLYAINWIVGTLNDCSGWFFELYLECYYYGWPLGLLATSFYQLSGFFNDLAWHFYDLGQWLYIVEDAIQDILSWSTIWSYILSYVPNLEAISSWFYNWADWVWSEVGEWWGTTSWTVQSWIDAASDFLQGQITVLDNWIAGLQSAWDAFQLKIPSIDAALAWFTGWRASVLGEITSWWTGAMADVQGLINSAFIEREPFWAGWQDWRDQVTEFFADPEDWLYKAADRIVERFW